MGTGQMPPEYEGRPGWKPRLENLEAIRRVDPEGYDLIMKKRREDQRKREDNRVDAFYKIDGLFSSNELEDYLDRDYLDQLYLDFDLGVLRPDVEIADAKRFLNEMLQKCEAEFKKLDTEEWELEKKLMSVHDEGLDRLNRHTGPNYKAVVEEINKVRRVKDGIREKCNRVEALIKAFNDATLDHDMPLKGLVDFIHGRVGVMRMRERES